MLWKDFVNMNYKKIDLGIRYIGDKIILSRKGYGDCLQKSKSVVCSDFFTIIFKFLLQVF